ncbi:Fe-S cluster assembly sulfur transfer protein SufU [Apilactobacillus xinyiensis]|uniref:Fe-S cluster assembly sulfur transfer protein SufU n=1 Tax=Apilactobacillus xinyiensis TaxID=2841032 RepID=UPI001C7D2685|nr:SUF system NifU family Fe-S cluster assembly protein [Apilactobacillus xinyiensis]
MDINEIYQRTIMDYAVRLKNKPLLNGQDTYQISLENPTCGDKLILSVQIKSGLVHVIAYQADGCVIFKAATAIMEKVCLKHSVTEINHLENQFSQMMMQQEIDNPKALGDAIALQAIVKLPVRIKCAMLPWKAMYQVLNEGEVDGR